ncbi:MAG: hypothetical protein C0483_09960 [Pirellula sp.]|nr:hypothetical protein [Pirellula sp.]
MADFETWESLGQNAYGTVYRGVQFSLKREVAIFQLDPSLRKEAERSPRFWDEITFLAQLTDDRLVPVFAVDRAQGWIVMELMCGHCAQLLKSPLDPEAARSVLRQGLAGLQRLHEQKRTHGDIRPHSLLLNRAGRIKLSFSVGAAVVGGLPYQKRLMKYVAPEAVSPAFGEYGPAADLYTLGFSVLELLLGPKFDGLFPGVGGNEQESRTAWMRWHAGEETKLPGTAELVPGASLELAMVLDRLLKKKAGDRYLTAEEALRDLSPSPLVPIVAPEIGVTGSAAGGGAELVGGVNRVFDPASKYDTATVAGASAPPPAAKGAASRTNAAAAKPKVNEKKKSRKAMIVAALFAVAAVGIFLIPEEPGAPAPGDVAEKPADVPPKKPPEPVVPPNQAPKFLATSTAASSAIPESAAWKLPIDVKDDATPRERLKLNLIEGPTGMTLDAKTGALVWTPSESQGPGKFKVRIGASDDATPPLSSEQALEVNVTEVNAAPVLQPVARVAGRVDGALRVKLQATDADLPAQKLRFAVAKASSLPEGAVLDAATGELTWTPSSLFAGKATKMKLSVADDGTPSLSAETEVEFDIAAENKPPVIAAIPDQIVTLPLETDGPALTLTVKARDPDAAPGSKMHIALAAPVPDGVKLDTKTGRITYSPDIGKDLSAKPVTISFEVKDSGTPPLTAKASFGVSFRVADLLARLREQLKKAKTVREISAVLIAAKELQEVPSVDPKGLRSVTAEAYVKRGDAYLSEQDFGSALVDFNTVVKELDVRHIDARLGRAFCYGRQGDWRTALAEYDDVLSLDDKNASAYLNRATAHYELKQYREAVSDAGKAIDLQPDNATAYFVRGNSKLTLKDQAGAFADLKQAIESFISQSGGGGPMLTSALQKQLEIMEANPTLLDAELVMSYTQRLAALKTGGAKNVAEGK